jgi:hypothetical protein
MIPAMHALPLRPGACGKRRFRECTVKLCRRGFYGAAGPCPDCRAGARLSQLLYRLKVERAGQAGTRRRHERILDAMLGSA